MPDISLRSAELTVSVYMGGRVDGMSPPAPTSSGSPRSASIFPDNN
jgi:hypothetical protein